MTVYECGKCKFKTTDLRFMDTHIEMSDHKCPVSLKCGDCDMVFETEMALKAHKQKSEEEYLKLIKDIKFLKDENIRRKKEINEVLSSQNGSSDVFEDFKQ